MAILASYELCDQQADADQHQQNAKRPVEQMQSCRHHRVQPMPAERNDDDNIGNNINHPCECGHADMQAERLALGKELAEQRGEEGGNFWVEGGDRKTAQKIAGHAALRRRHCRLVFWAKRGEEQAPAKPDQQTGSGKLQGKKQCGMMGDDEEQAGRRDKGIEKNAEAMAECRCQPASAPSGLGGGQDDREARPRRCRAKNADKCEGQPVGNAHGHTLTQIRSVNILFLKGCVGARHVVGRDGMCLKSLLPKTDSTLPLFSVIVQI